MTQHKTLIDRWYKDVGKSAELRELLARPVMQEAIAILQSDALPQPVAHELTIRNRTATDAAFVIAQMHSTQAGIQRAINRLNLLASARPDKVSEDAPEPFSHINEEYFNQQ